MLYGVHTIGGWRTHCCMVCTRLLSLFCYYPCLHLWCVPRYPLHEAAEVALEACRDACASVQEVHFVLYDTSVDILGVFCDAAQRLNLQAEDAS